MAWERASWLVRCNTFKNVVIDNFCDQSLDVQTQSQQLEASIILLSNPVEAATEALGPEYTPEGASIRIYVGRVSWHVHHLISTAAAAIRNLLHCSSHRDVWCVYYNCCRIVAHGKTGVHRKYSGDGLLKQKFRHTGIPGGTWTARREIISKQ